MKKSLLFLAFLICAAFYLSGCSNTLDGAGRDIERAGEKIQETF